MNDSAQSVEGVDELDLKQFYPIFFEEATENLDAMEKMLLSLNPDVADEEELNGIFRCAHSIKGGASTFGFSDVAALTHQMESLLDRLRRRELRPTSAMVDVLLQSADASRALLTRHQSGDSGGSIDTDALVQRIMALSAGSGEQEAVSSPSVGSVGQHDRDLGGDPLRSVDVGRARVVRAIELKVGPVKDPSVADAVEALFREIPGLGHVEDRVVASDGVWTFLIRTDSSTDDLVDLLAFHVASDQVKVKELSAEFGSEPSMLPDDAHRLHSDGHADSASLPGAGATPTALDAYGFFEGAPGAPATEAPVRASRPLGSPGDTRANPAASAIVGPVEATTIRVSVNKVDQLINLVGELVITQAMLAQQGRALDPTTHQKMMAGLADLDRNTRELQESVMSIRMIPMSVVFSRFPRMLRDLAGKLGKKVEFETFGESTELDKGLVEKITDPLTHLVRNSCDHGIELPADRVTAGKPECGTITLSAAHQGGSIVIQVRDDGRGMSRSKILAKARERGMDVSDDLPDTEVWQLIFAPGFSTAETVTDVSGRGVGMDVVKRNITALNGTVDVESLEGQGSVVSVRLPLTLAIMDGMSVGVGSEVYMLPLSSVVESFKVKSEAVSTIGHDASLVRVRDEYMPVIELEKVFAVPRGQDQESGDIMVVIEAEGRRVALLVDELLGQQQVVVKNLETNYRKVRNVSGATILGDGKVALILDTVALVRRGALTG